MAFDIYSAVTERVIQQLEQGCVFRGQSRGQEHREEQLVVLLANPTAF